MTKDIVGSNSTIIHTHVDERFPSRRPDISVARAKLGWKPVVDVRDGIRKTVEYFRKEMLRDDIDGIPTESHAQKLQKIVRDE